MEFLKHDNVGLFCDSFPPVMDGVSVCMQNYAHWMQKKVGGVSVITPNVPGADYSTLDYQVLDYFSVPVPMRHPYVTGIAEIDPVFLAKIARIRFKIVHAHCPFATGLAAQRIALLQGIPCVGTFHSKYRDDFGRVLPKPMTDAIVKAIVAFYEHCDAVWVPQESVIDVIREYGYKGPVEAMDNGSDLVDDYPEKFFVEARKNLGIAPDEFVLLFVGQHIWEKNPRLIIESLEKIPDVRYRMYFIGNGYAADAMRQLVSEKGLDNRVTFIKTITNRAKLTQYYAAADLFLFPSLYDNAPLVVREAAALHTPAVMAAGATASTIIATPSAQGNNADDLLAHSGANPDTGIIPPFSGENGFLVQNNPDDMSGLLRALSKDPERVRRAGIQASKTIVRSWEDVVDEVLDRYNSILRARNLPLIQ